MGKTTESKNTQTQYSLSPEQRQIMQSAMKRYLPNGELPTSAPTFDWNANPELRASGANFISPFSGQSQQAFDATAEGFGAHKPTMDVAKGMTMASAGPAGQFQGAPDGWSTDDQGNAVYQDFATGVERYSSPFTKAVIDRGIKDLNYARERADVATNNDSVAKGSFGGTRQAVRGAINDRSYGDAAERLITTNRQAGFDRAVDQYNQGFGQGQQALNYNLGKSQSDRDAVARAGTTMAGMAETNQRLLGNDINAMRTVGQTIEDKDQAMRDAARAAQLQDDTYGLGIASTVAGLGPPPSSTTNTENRVSSSSIWNSIGAAAAAGGTQALMMSDEDAKEGMRDADPEDALAQLRKLKPKRFEYTDVAQMHGAPEGRRTGFTAQDMEKATGEAAPMGPGGFKHVDMPDLLGRLVHAVQALDAKVRGSRKAA